jgi:hypothetical protein
VLNITGFRRLHVPTDNLPELTDQQQRALIGIASIGGSVARLALSRVMLTDLLRAAVIADAAPGTVEITGIGIRWLAHLAATHLPAPSDA